MRSKLLAAGAVLPLAASAAFASGYDPYRDRTALRAAATAAYDAAARALGLPLAPEKAANIKAALDECLSQASLASNTAKSLETNASARGDEMAGELKGHGAPAPASAAKDLGDVAAAARARWRSLGQDRANLWAALSSYPDGTPGKADLAASLGRSAAALSAADSALSQAETAAPAAAAAVAQMEDAERRARRSADERSAESASIFRLDDALTAAVAEAKDALGLLGQEPQGPNRTRVGRKLGVPRDLAGQLLSAADRACNRADDYRSRAADFEKAQAAYDSVQKPGAAAAAKARTSLDDADKTQADVRQRLGRLRSPQ